MLLKWILNVLVLWVLYRLVRGLFRSRNARRVGPEPRRKLDPDRAVDARWSEVADEGAEGKS